VESLHFWRITDKSSSSSSSHGSSVSSLRRPRRPRRPFSRGPVAPAPLLIAARAHLSFSRRFPGTFSFELWFESYLVFIVESMHFWRITDQSSSSSSSPGSSISSLRRPRHPRRPFSRGPVAPAPLLIAPRAHLSFSRRFPGLALVFPGRSTSHRRRSSCHARRRRRQLLFARAAPLSALKHAQRLLPNLVYPHARSISRTIPFPERSSSPERRRSLCSPASAAHTASHPRSSAREAPPRPTAAH
jgi:hypothetical protein